MQPPSQGVTINHLINEDYSNKGPDMDHFNYLSDVRMDADIF